MLRIMLVLFIVGEAVAQVPVRGVCPDVKTVPNFNLSRYMGNWYEVRKYFLSYGPGSKCATAEYALAGNGSFRMKNTQISSITGLESTIRGIASPIGNSDDAKFIVTFPYLPVGIDEAYWVLGTDYDHWTLVWSCKNSGNSSYRQSWILTRARNPGNPTLKKAYEAMKRTKIDAVYFLERDQKKCPKSY